MAAFYEKVTGIPAIFYTDDFAELKSQQATLAIGSTKTLALFGADEFAKAAHNKTVIIEFRVKDVDEDYKRLSVFLKDLILQKPTTLPWGNRSLLFRDPDGNLVNFFTPVTNEEIKKFDGETNYKI